MAKLTKQQWASVRKKWESDKREGHQWLADELVKKGFDINRVAIAKAASRQGWAKNVTNGKSDVKSDKKVIKNVTDRIKRNARETVKETKAVDNAEWEEVNEIVEKLHLNSKYDQGFDEMAFKLCLLGATNEELADFFHVSIQTLNVWRHTFPNFDDAINKGKIEADAEVAKSLYKRACGYRYQETKTRKVLSSEVDEDGNEKPGELKAVELITTIKEIPPDTDAAFKWLRNRRSQDWRDKIEVQGEIGVNQLDIAALEQRFVSRMMEAHERQLKVLEDRGVKNA